MLSGCVSTSRGRSAGNKSSAPWRWKIISRQTPATAAAVEFNNVTCRYAATRYHPARDEMVYQKKILAPGQNTLPEKAKSLFGGNYSGAVGMRRPCRSLGLIIANLTRPLRRLNDPFYAECWRWAGF
jgi:hypothetical protein